MRTVGKILGTRAKRRLKAEALNRRNPTIPNEINGRGEWIRTTDVLVPNQKTPAISFSTEQYFCKKLQFRY